MLQSRLQRHHGVVTSTAERLRVQLAIGLLVAVALPVIARANFMPQGILGQSTIFNSMIATTIAVVLGIMLFRRFRNFPGVRAYEYVLPSFFSSYGLVMGVLLVFRFDYVVSVLVASLGLSIITFFALCYFGLRSTAYVFHVVPSGDVSRLEQISNVEWVPLLEPILPASPGSGIVVDLRGNIDDQWERLLADAALEGIPVYHLKQLLESITGQLEIEHISENGLGSLTPNEGYGKLKQLSDVAAAIILLPVLLPLLAIVAIAIKLDTRGPVLFRQQRMGFRGKPFQVYKFRTMHQPPALPASSDDECRRAMTQNEDHRITAVGRFLRRTRVDELPQILNILRGEMSWIGPRPEAVSLSNWYQRELPFYSYRHVVKPGITGWAQVNQGHVAEIGDVHHKLCYDFYYIKYLSSWLDALILFRTVRTVISGSGSK